MAANKDPFKKKIKLSDAEFIAMYEDEFGENKAAMGRELGVTPQAIGKKVKAIRAKIEKGEPLEDKSKKKRKTKVTPARADHAGKATVLAKAVKATRGKHTARKARSFDRSMGEAISEMALLEQMATSLERVQSLQASIEKEMADAKKIKPFQADLLLKTITASNRLLTDAHKIRKDLMSMAAIRTWMQTVVDIIEEETPDVQSRIFSKLSRMGLAEQATVIDAAADAASAGDPDGSS